MAQFKYRPDVDGLRAVAVVLVLLFHAHLGFRGGFIGVDVFFVISGFLITGLILKEQETNRFHLGAFWLRRIRRILPAVVCAVSGTLVLGCLLLLPADLEQLARSAIAQQLMLANFYFWQNTDYFAGPAELQPLLHTWSLAVEEQFYVVYPFLLILCRPLRRSRRVFLLATIAVLSFAASLWATYTYPAAAFYLAPWRAWELLLGALLAAAPAPHFRSWAANGLSALGMAAILIPAWLYDAATAFPGWAAAVPCLGTALVIYSNTATHDAAQLTWVGRGLAFRPVVGVGLISYSLYLWHWPILVYARYWTEENALPWMARIAALAASFVCAYGSWKWVETPFRQSGRSARQLLLGASGAMAAVVGAGVLINTWHGLPQRWPLEVRQIAERSGVPKHYRREVADARSGNLPVIGSEEPGPEGQPRPLTFLVWGDSHALAVANLCDALARENQLRGCIAARPGTTPLLGTWRPAFGPSSVEWNQAVLAFAQAKQIQHVILVSRWEVNMEGRPDGRQDTLIVDAMSVGPASLAESRRVMRRGLDRTVAALGAAGIRVWIMKQVPLQPTDPTKQLMLAAYVRRPLPVGVPLGMHEQRQCRANEVLDRLPSTAATILNPADFAFDEQGRSRIGNAEGSFYADDDHLSPLGAEHLLRPLLEPVFRKMADDQVALGRKAGMAEKRAVVGEPKWVEKSTLVNPSTHSH